MITRGEVRLGIDIGGTKTAVGLVDSSGRVLAVESAPSGRGGAEVVAVAAGLAQRIRAAGAEGTNAGDVVGIGACMPGLVDTTTGFVRHAVNLAVDDLDLAGALTAATGLPVHVDNDVKAAARGAHRVVSARAGAPVHGALGYLNLGTGLAAAVVRDGVLDRGASGSAGEIGHLPMMGPDAEIRCGCGQLGCLETVASGAAFRRQWAGGDPFEAARSGDAVVRAAATAAIEGLSRGVGLAVQILVAASGADYVVIGGGLSSLGEPLAEAVRRSIADRAASSEFLRELDLGRRFELLPPGTPVGVIGAALMAAAGAGVA